MVKFNQNEQDLIFLINPAPVDATMHCRREINLFQKGSKELSKGAFSLEKRIFGKRKGISRKEVNLANARFIKC